MAERPEDLNLPNAVVTRIIKDAIPEGVSVSKEARLAISKAASVFVLYATSCSNNFALKNKRKTITAQDVLSAMEDMEFEQFIEPLQQCQEVFRLEKMEKEKKKDKTQKPAAAPQPVNDDEDNDVQEVSDNDDTRDEGSSEQKPSSGQEDNGDDDFVITVNKEDMDSDESSPEVVDAGD